MRFVMMNRQQGKDKNGNGAGNISKYKQSWK